MFLAKHGLILALREQDLNLRPSGYESDDTGVIQYHGVLNSTQNREIWQFSYPF